MNVNNVSPTESRNSDMSNKESHNTMMTRITVGSAMLMALESSSAPECYENDEDLAQLEEEATTMRQACGMTNHSCFSSSSQPARRRARLFADSTTSNQVCLGGALSQVAQELSLAEYNLMVSAFEKKRIMSVQNELRMDKKHLNYTKQAKQKLMKTLPEEMELIGQKCVEMKEHILYLKSRRRELEHQLRIQQEA